MTLRLARHALNGSPATPPLRHEGGGSFGELDLARRERFLLAVGVHIACATIAIVDRPNARRRGRPD
jgi:hypothetical protein